MTNTQAEEFIKYVLHLRSKGIKEEKEIIIHLKEKFSGTEDDFILALEMMSTGAFRASILCNGNHYPNSNLKIEDNPILETAFRMFWIQQKGEEHYQKNYVNKGTKWWKFW